MIFPPELIRNINSGRCFALVGAGPSCELGYPSWAELARSVHDHLKSSGKIKDQPAYDSFASNRDYPAFFRQAELDAGSRDALITILREYLKPKAGRHGYIYEFLTGWPFACYLTTNYDNELSDRLKKEKHFFQVLQNRLPDFQSLRDSVSNVILKLHGDLDHPRDLVLTSRDYDRVSVGEPYFRTRLRAAMEMFDLFIIGHSLSDFDLGLVLREAKQTVSARNPIYMTAPDINTGVAREYSKATILFS
jgi:hypothetical protein